jgi:HD-GYP domain-containing protein (c-di-GMP phosphodiesterase class II)
MILEHHERLDGSGYPNQLKNKEIYIGSQVISIADVTSAMLENRPYRVAHKFETVKEELIKNAGIKYNPIMVDIVTDLMDQQPEFFHAKA